MFKCSKEGCDEPYDDSKIEDMIVIYTPHEKVRNGSTTKSKSNVRTDPRKKQLSYEER